MNQSGVLQPQQQPSPPPPPPPPPLRGSRVLYYPLPPPPLQQQQLAHHTTAKARVLSRQSFEKDWTFHPAEVRGMEHYSWGVPAPR